MAAVRVISRQTIEQAVSLSDLIQPVADSLMAYSAGSASVPPIGLIPLPASGEAHIKSGYIQGGRFFVVKIATMCPANRHTGVATSNGVMVVCDANTGEPATVLQDEKVLTDMRTAAVGALAAKLLSRPESSRVCVVGTGGQAFWQVKAITLVRPVSHVVVWGRDPKRSLDLVHKIGKAMPFAEVWAVSSVRDAIAVSDIIVTATASHESLVQGEWLRPGQHITAVGADDESKCELDPSCFARATHVVVDSRKLAFRFGDVAWASHAGAIAKKVMVAELGEILLGKHDVTRTEEDITISKHIGIGVEDVAAAKVALDRIKLSE